MSSEIRASSNDIPAIIADFIKNLEIYNEKMTDNIREINQAIQTLGQYWVDEDYRDFREKMMKHNQRLESEIEKGKELKTELNEIKKGYEMLLELMKGASR